MTDVELARLLNEVYAAGVMRGLSVLAGQRIDSSDDRIIHEVRTAFERAENNAVKAALGAVVCCHVCKREELEYQDVRICCIGCRRTDTNNEENCSDRRRSSSTS